ncbi:MAG: HAD family hydrolase [Chloroflexi bacterium]|nr:HAD family hydrolase [Chloroflexota bacterium]
MIIVPFNQIQAVLFDLDGTLIETDDLAVAQVERWLRPLFAHRAPHIARWLMMKAETPGNALITLLDWLHLDLPLMGFTDRLRRRRGVYPAPEFVLIDGVDEMLLALAQRYPLALVTTRSRYHIDQFLLRFPQLADVFTTTCGLQDTRRLKPHPEPVYLAAARLGVPVTNCLMVGDTTADVLAARRAGAWSAAVLCGFGERGELSRAGAHVIFPSTADATPWLMKL